MKQIEAVIYNISFTRGDTFGFSFNIEDLTEEDLTHAYMTLKEKSNPEGEALFIKKLNDGITKIENGLYKVQIERADTIKLVVDAPYIYDIEVRYGSAIKTIIKGAFQVTQDCTTPKDVEEL